MSLLHSTCKIILAELNCCRNIQYIQKNTETAEENAYTSVHTLDVSKLMING